MVRERQMMTAGMGDQLGGPFSTWLPSRQAMSKSAHPRISRARPQTSDAAVPVPQRYTTGKLVA